MNEHRTLSRPRSRLISQAVIPCADDFSFRHPSLHLTVICLTDQRGKDFGSVVSFHFKTLFRSNIIHSKFSSDTLIEKKCLFEIILTIQNTAKKKNIISTS